MALSLEDRLKLLVPSSIYYRHKIKSEIGKGEPELAVLSKLVSPDGGMAIDIGANRGIYSFVLASLYDCVLAFEPNSDLAYFARHKLPKNVEVLEVAMGAFEMQEELRVPIDEKGRDLHLLGSLAHASKGTRVRTQKVMVRPLDSINTASVRFIKIDVEGTEMDVIAGAAEVIARDRPILLVELLAGYYEDPVNCIATICRDHGYDARILVDREMVDAAHLIRSGDPIDTRNVVFTPRVFTA